MCWLERTTWGTVDMHGPTALITAIRLRNEYIERGDLGELYKTTTGADLRSDRWRDGLYHFSRFLAHRSDAEYPNGSR